MYNVSVVPDNSEILCRRFESGEATNDLIGKCYSVRIGILRNAEKALNAFILDIFLDCVHVRAVVVHFDIYHLDAEMLKNSEMSVVAGAGAEKFNLTLLDPWLVAAAAEYHAL